MPTTSQAEAFNTNINSYIALLFVGSFALGVGLVVWQAAVGDNPIADFMVKSAALQVLVQQ